jgi:hypothetical protein
MGHSQRAEPFEVLGAWHGQSCCSKTRYLLPSALPKRKKSTHTHLDGDSQTSDDAIAINHNITHRALPSVVTDFWVVL